MVTRFGLNKTELKTLSHAWRDAYEDKAFLNICELLLSRWPRMRFLLHLALSLRSGQLTDRNIPVRVSKDRGVHKIALLHQIALSPHFWHAMIISFSRWQCNAMQCNAIQGNEMQSISGGQKSWLHSPIQQYRGRTRYLMTAIYGMWVYLSTLHMESLICIFGQSIRSSFHHLTFLDDQQSDWTNPNRGSESNVSQ
jgi:hypothetical protein